MKTQQKQRSMRNPWSDFSKLYIGWAKHQLDMIERVLGINNGELINSDDLD